MAAIFNIVTGGKTYNVVCPNDLQLSGASSFINLSSATTGGLQMADGGRIGTKSAAPPGQPDSEYIKFDKTNGQVKLYAGATLVLDINAASLMTYKSITNSGASASIGTITAGYQYIYASGAVGVVGGFSSWKSLLVGICDSIQINCRFAFLDARIAEYGLGVYDYTTLYNEWTATAGGAVTAGWSSRLKAYGVRTTQWRAKISTNAADSFYFGENDGGNNYWRVKKGTTAGNIKFETDNGTGAPQVTDEIVVNPANQQFYKVTVDDTVTTLSVGGVVKATHNVKPCPTTVIQTGYWYATAGAAYVLTMREIYQILGVALP